MGIGLAVFQFDSPITIKEIISRAESIGGLAIRCVYQEEHIESYEEINEITSKELEEFYDKQTAKELSQELLSNVEVYQWICQFADEDIGSSVEIAIDDKTNRVRMVQFSGAYCILYRLLLYTLTDLGGYHPHTREAIVCESHEFPICVKKIQKQEKMQTLLAILLAPFFVLGFLLMRLFSITKHFAIKVLNTLKIFK